jgi:hypothetical protein
MPRYRKKPVEIEAVQWHRNGDHPQDGPADREGRVVRYFRRPEPEYDGRLTHGPCGRIWHDHGWIDTLEGGNDGAQVVCPGDWIVTGVQGEHYPVKPDIFAATYEPAGPCRAGSSAPNALGDERCTLPAGHTGRHDDGNLTWPASEATDEEKTARVLSGLYRSAEEDVTRVIGLYERWVKAGPPPLGTSLARWWDARLGELRTALNPDA